MAAAAVSGVYMHLHGATPAPSDFIPVLAPSAAVAQKLWCRFSALRVPKPVGAVVCDKARLSRAQLVCAPESFVLDPSDPARDEGSLFLAAFDTSEGAMWIAKPSLASCAT